MELPNGNPYKDLLNQKFEGILSQKGLEVAIAIKVAENPFIYQIKPIPELPIKLKDFFSLSDENKQKVWRTLQYDKDVLKYDQSILERKDNVHNLRIFIDVLAEFPEYQNILKNRLSEYETPEFLKTGRENDRQDFL